MPKSNKQVGEQVFEFYTRAHYSHTEGDAESITRSGISDGSLMLTGEADKSALETLDRTVRTGEQTSALQQHWSPLELARKVKAEAQITAAMGQQAHHRPHGAWGNADGHGTTHHNSTVTAKNNLTLASGHDTILKGAQAKADHIDADIGRDLILASQQDTYHYKSKSQSAGGSLTVGVGVSGSAYYSSNSVNNDYASVTHQTGLQAGQGGYDINVGHHTELTGAAIASTADPSQNYLSTGTLSYEAIHNSTGYGVGMHYDSAIRGENKINMAGTGLQVPTGDDRSGTTHSSIAKGTLIIRDGGTTDIRRHSDGNNGQVDAYDVKEIAEKTELANGIVSTVGGVASSIYRYRAQQYNEAITAKRNEANERELQGDQQGADSLRKQAFQLALERDNPTISEASVNTLGAVAGSLVGGGPSLSYVATTAVANKLGQDWTDAGKGFNETWAVEVSCGKQEKYCQNGPQDGFQLSDDASTMERIQQLEDNGYTIRVLDRIPNGAKHIATNGILNDPARASQVMIGFVADDPEQKTTHLYLQYNPTHGGVSDLMQAGWDKGIAPLADEYLATTLAEANAVQRADEDVTLYGHSWGSITTRNTLNILKERGYKNEHLGVQVFGAAVSPESIVEPMEAITGKKGIDLIENNNDSQVYYYNDPDDFVVSVAGGTAFGHSEYLNPKSDKHLPGSSQGDLWKSTKALPVIFKSGINPHSCYKNNCLGTQWNWTVDDALHYGQRRDKQQTTIKTPLAVQGHKP